MQWLRMTRREQDALLARLASMPSFLRTIFGALSESDALAPGPDGSFSPVEHCWHLADLEREGYAVRIRRLLEEADPTLPDFDGARIAEERKYRTRALVEGLEAFASTREANLRKLRSIEGGAWRRSGIQERFGKIMLCDLPVMMAQHDDSHRQEIAEWTRSRQRNAGSN